MTRYTINTGISFSQAICNKLSYTVGFNGANLNQPVSNARRTELKALALSTTYSASFGAHWNVCQKVSVRPAAYYEIISNPLINRTNNMVGGTDVQLNFGTAAKHTFFSNLFTGMWYHGGSRVIYTLGTELKGFRIAAGFDTGPMDHFASNIGSVYTFQVQYIAPQNSKHKRVIVCDRF